MAKAVVQTACGPLLEILPDEKRSVIHHYFTEYLKGTTRKDDRSGYPVFKPGATNAKIAIHCLQYLRSGCLGKVVSEIDGRIIHDPDDFKPVHYDNENAVEHRLSYPFLDYAVKNWVCHVNKSEASGYDQSEVNIEIERSLGELKLSIAWRKLKRSGYHSTDMDQIYVAAETGLVSYLKRLLQTGKWDAKALNASPGNSPL